MRPRGLGGSRPWRGPFSAPLLGEEQPPECPQEPEASGVGCGRAGEGRDSACGHFCKDSGTVTVSCPRAHFAQETEAPRGPTVSGKTRTSPLASPALQALSLTPCPLSAAVPSLEPSGVGPSGTHSAQCQPVAEPAGHTLLGRGASPEEPS